MITITPHPEGCVLAVRAQPGARKAGVMGEQAGALKVAVTAPPEDGRANQALMELLRDWLGLKRSQVVLANGLTNRNKQYLIRGVTADKLQATIAARLAPPRVSGGGGCAPPDSLGPSSAAASPPPR